MVDKPSKNEKKGFNLVRNATKTPPPDLQAGISSKVLKKKADSP